MNPTNSNIDSKSNKDRNKLQISDDILSQAKFPGEFDEVKAILMTWNYFTFDTTGEFTEQLFDGLGVYYNASTKEYSLGPVFSMIDTFQVSPYPPIFADLAYGINKHTQVWINVWSPQDSTLILNYMNSIGKSLTNYRFFVHPGNSYWYRDSGPMAFYFGDKDDLAFLDMEYYGGRPLDDSIPQLIANDLEIPFVQTSIEWEGGNVLVDGDANLFTSNAVYLANSDTYGQYYQDEYGDVFETEKLALTRNQVNDSLKRILNLQSLKVLSSLQYDGGTGHIDLYADMWNENSFVFSQMPDAMSSFVDFSIVKKNIDSILSVVRADKSKYSNGKIPFPKKDNGSWYLNNNDYANYTRTYSNHTFVNKAILQPVFANESTGDKVSMEADLDSIRAKYPGYEIIPIDVRAFDGFGGAIHCITKQIPADNPILFSHHSPVNGIKTQASYDLVSRISNQSGIESATIFYRLKGENERKEGNLTDNGDGTFSYSISNNAETGTFEYYFSITSKNGKTVLKPMTAPAGLYSFSFKKEESSAPEDIANSNLNVFYPNPASTEARITFNNIQSYVELEIVNIKGERIYSNVIYSLFPNDELVINTNSFANGSYFAHFKLADGSIQTRTFIVNR
jgi:agmatine/peptidylarginine deiminase